MTRFGWGVACALLVLVMGIGAAAWWYHHKTPVVAAPVVEGTTTAPVLDPSALSIYTSGEYGFTFFYPASGVITDAYTATTTGNLAWRVGATAPGTLITRVQIDGGEVRIGQSNQQRELSACTKVGPAEKTLGTLSIASTTWSKYSFQKLGTDDEEQVTSYRTIHSGNCVALEMFQPLNNIASSTSFSLEDIAQSFTFAN